MICYKGLDNDMKGYYGFNFEIGKIYDTGYNKNELKMYSNTVFHYCKKLANVNNFYSFDDSKNRYFEVEILGDEITDDNIKFGTNKIKIIREINIVDYLSELSKDEDWSVRRAVAYNAKTPTETLTLLAKDEDWGVRYAVAYNVNTPIEILTVLSKDGNCYVRCAVACNAKTPTETLTLLAKDEDWGVRRAVACNAKTPTETLTLLAKDEDWSVQYAVDYNVNAPIEILTVLLKDRNCYMHYANFDNTKKPKKIKIMGNIKND